MKNNNISIDKIIKICYYVGMSHHEKSNTINTPENAERLADPIIQREVADAAIDSVTADPNPDELSLKQQAEALVANLSYEDQVFSSPAELMQREKNPRAVRGFIESRRNNPDMPAIFHLADEIWLRNSSSKSRNSARSDEYLQVLLDQSQNPEIPGVSEEAIDQTETTAIPEETPPSNESTTPSETDQPSGNTKPAITITPAGNTNSPTQPGAAPGNQSAPAGPTNPSGPTSPGNPMPRSSTSGNQQPSSTEPQVGIRITPVENEKLDEPKLKEIAGWKADVLRINEELRSLKREIALSEADPKVKLPDPITVQRQAQAKKLESDLERLAKNLERSNLTSDLSAETDRMANDLFNESQEKATKQAAQAIVNRQAKIDSFLTLPPSARQQRKQKRAEDLAQLRSDRKLMSDRLEDSNMSDDLKKVVDLLAKHDRKVGGGRLSALAHMAWRTEHKWRDHPIHAEEGLDLDAKEQRKDLDEILFAEEGMLVKMFTANGIDYNNLTPTELHDVLFAADAKNVLRSSRVAGMGRVSCLVSGLVNIGDALVGSANAGLNLAIILPRSGQPLYGYADHRRYAAIAHLDQAAAKAAEKRRRLAQLDYSA